MTIATKNGSIIVKNGSIAENCGCCASGWYCYGCPQVCASCNTIPDSLTATISCSLKTCKTEGADQTISPSGSLLLTTAGAEALGFYYPAITCKAWGGQQCGLFGRELPSYLRLTVAIVALNSQYLLRSYLQVTASVAPDPPSGRTSCAGYYFASDCFPYSHYLTYVGWYKEVDITSAITASSSGQSQCSALFPMISGADDVSLFSLGDAFSRDSSNNCTLALTP